MATVGGSPQDRTQLGSSSPSC